MKYYSLDNILTKKATYNVIFGERSNGKTYAVLKYALEDYIKNGNQLAIIRRWDEDFKGIKGHKVYDGIVESGVVTKLTKGLYNSIMYYSSQWYLVRLEDGKVVQKEEKAIALAFSLTSEEHYKSTSYPYVKTILFDEFLTRQYYLPDEFIKFSSVVSTIVRLRDDVNIFMLGNTVNKFCPYFSEMGLTHIKNMKKGTIDLYTYGESGLTVAVEYSDFPTKEKKSNKYFAFDNPKLKMVTEGAWEIAIYPHIPTKYKPKDILYKYYIIFDGDILQCEIIRSNDMLFTFIHRKTTPIKDSDKGLRYQLEVNADRRYKRNITKAFTPLEKKIISFFAQEKVFYQDNEVGEIVRNYINTCTCSNIQ